VRFIPLNWSIGVFFDLTASVIIAIACGKAWKFFKKVPNISALLVLVAEICVFLWALFQAIAFLVLSIIIVYISAIAFIFGMQFLLFFVDYNRKESISPFTLIFSTIFVFGFLWSTRTLDTAFQTYTDLFGNLFYASIGDSNIFLDLSTSVSGLVYIWYQISLFKQAPHSLKSSARRFMLAFIVFGLLNCIIGLLFQYSIPGGSTLVFGLLCLTSIMVLKNEPNLIYLLPFKVIHLTVFDTTSGIPIYTYSWKTDPKNVNNDLFTGMIQGISLLLKESLNQGNLEEIKMHEGKLIIQRIKDTPIACILITTRISKTLRDALRTFADQFNEKFSPYFNNTNKIDQFKDASEIIKSCFAFVPEFD
jgi:hypothetical protein